MYNQQTCFEQLKQWIPRVPVYFATIEKGGELFMLMKQNIYNCQTFDLQKWMNKQQNYTIIGDYLKSKHAKAIIVIHHGIKEEINKMKDIFTQRINNIPESIVIMLPDFMRAISLMHGKQFNFEDFNDKMKQSRLENYYQPCEFHGQK